MSPTVAALAEDEGRAEAAMLGALGSILRHGAFGNEQVDTLVAVANDNGAELGARCLARHTIDWLLQRSARHGQFWRNGSDPIN